MNFPGLVKECRAIAKELDILQELNNENVNKFHFKQTVKTAILKKNEEELRKEMANYSKLKGLDGESYGRKEYLKDLTLEEARLNFRIRGNMTEFGFNFRNKKEYADKSWFCQSCDVAIDTFDHAKWCVAHEDLREGRDLENEKDLVWYIGKVLARREKEAATSKRKPSSTDVSN